MVSLGVFLFGVASGVVDEKIGPLVLLIRWVDRMVKKTVQRSISCDE